jgi:GT2 family glycosyltransferase
MNRISIVIITYNSGSVLHACLNELAGKDRATAPENSEWIIVDNNSTDGSIEIALQKYPHIRLLRNMENRGFAVAANQGWRMAQNEQILFLNTDVEIFEDSIQKLIGILQREPKAGVAGPRLRRKNLTIQKSVCPQPTLSNELLRPLFKLRTSLMEPLYRGNAHYIVPSLRGACFLMRRCALESVNGFDERYFFYLEETDLFLRLQQKGWKILYCPCSEVIHLGGLGADGASFNKRKMYYTSLQKYFDKNRPSWEALLLRMYLKIMGKQ